MFSAGFRNLCSAGVLASVMALGFAGAAEARGAKDTNDSDIKGLAAEGTQTDPLKRPSRKNGDRSKSRSRPS